MNIAEWLASTARLRPDAPALLTGFDLDADYQTFASRASAIGALQSRIIVRQVYGSKPGYVYHFAMTAVVKSAVLNAGQLLPLDPNQQSISEPRRTSARGKRKWPPRLFSPARRRARAGWSIRAMFGYDPCGPPNGAWQLQIARRVGRNIHVS